MRAKPPAKKGKINRTESETGQAPEKKKKIADNEKKRRAPPHKLH